MDTPAILVLEDGTSFRGRSIGKQGIAVGEVCFYATMTGYSEALTNPAISGRLLALTYPHAGNVGMNPAFAESGATQAAGLIVRDQALITSSWRSQQSLPDFLIDRGVVAISGIDTRKLTRLLRDKGAQRGCIMAGQVDAGKALIEARAAAGLEGVDWVQAVTTQESYQWTRRSWRVDDGAGESPECSSSELQHHVVALDFGVTRSTLCRLVDSGCRVTVVPAQTSVEDIVALQPDGVFLSGGPGDPQSCDYAIETVRQLLERNMPMFGLCLGSLVLAIASGARSSKMKCGHYGSGHPVIDLESSRVMMTGQSHAFMVDEASLPATLRVTHRSLLDDTLQGFQLTDRPAIGFQGYPEAPAGLHESPPLYAQFVELMAQLK